MPTGYTSKINDGKEVSRNEFIMTCARAFGALIMMRDEPFDTPIPERFEPSNYAIENLDRAQQQLEHYKSLNEADAKAEMEKEHQEEMKKYEQMIQRENDLKQRYQALLDEVKTWNPPTPNHEELKKFCIDQLQQSMDHDCDSSRYMKIPELQTPENWLQGKIAYVEREIDYYKNSYQKEVERTENRNEWLKLLRESLSSIEPTE